MSFRRKQMIKRIIGIVMCCICIMLTVNVDVFGKNTENVSISKFDKIDELYELQVKALMEQNWNEYEAISDLLQNAGCEEITYGELMSLTGLNNENELVQTCGTSLSNISFSKATSTVSYNGKKYKVMKITAIPNGEGYLYQTGVTTQTNKNKVKAGILSLIKSSVAGAISKVGIDMTVFDVVKDLISSVSSTTQVKQIKANYTWTVAETINFIYVYDKNCKNYVLSARYNKVQHNVDVSIPVLKCSNGTFNSRIAHKSYSSTKKSSNYGSSSKAISYFNTGKVYSPYLTSIKIEGVKGTIVKTSLKNPESAGHIGYGW